MISVSQAEIAEALKTALGPLSSVTRCDPLLKGHGHQSFVLETDSNARLLLKIARRREQLDTMKSLRRVLELTARHGVPAPRLLYFSEGTASFAGRPWLIQEFLPGQDGEVAMMQMSEGQRTAFFRDFGRVVARLHSIDLGYFSEDLTSGRRDDTWRSMVESRLERLAERHREAALLPRRNIDAARSTILATMGMVAGDVRPALVHRDLYLPNTLAYAGRFRCLLDFEHARSADPVCDFVKLHMWVFDRVPGSEAEFCSGYEVNPLRTSDGRRRHHVWLGLELLAGLSYWQQTGQAEMLADYQARFQRWIAGGLAATAL